MGGDTKRQGGELIVALVELRQAAGELDFDRVAQAHAPACCGNAAAATSVQPRSMRWSQRRSTFAGRIVRLQLSAAQVAF